MDPHPAAGTPPSDRRVVPLFPLPHVWLFPFVLRPLHIFEERYKRMIEDILDGPGRLVLGTVQPGHERELAGAPPIHPVAGLGEIGRHEKLSDGRFDILLMGLQRVRVEEVASDRPYRLVAVEALEEIPVAPEREEDLRARLVQGIQERTRQAPAFPPGVSISRLADLLILGMPLPHGVLNELFGELDAGARAERALAEHRVRPHVPRPPGTELV